MTPDEAIRLHEAGHQVAAHAFGYRSGGVTVRGGTSLAGCSFHLPDVPPEAVEAIGAAIFDGRPFITWPAATRGALEIQAVITMAGQADELVLAAPAPAARRLPAPVAEQVEDLAAELPGVEAAGPSAGLLATFARSVDDPDVVSDAEQIARRARAIHYDDPAAMGCWLRFLETSARGLVVAEAARIRRLADVLELQHSLSGEQVAAVLAGDR